MELLEFVEWKEVLESSVRNFCLVQVQPLQPGQAGKVRKSGITNWSAFHGEIGDGAKRSQPAKVVVLEWPLVQADLDHLPGAGVGVDDCAKADQFRLGRRLDQMTGLPCAQGQSKKNIII